MKLLAYILLAAIFVVPVVIAARPAPAQAICDDCLVPGQYQRCKCCPEECCGPKQDRCCCLHVDKCTCVPPPTRPVVERGDL